MSPSSNGARIRRTVSTSSCDIPRSIARAPQSRPAPLAGRAGTGGARARALLRQTLLGGVHGVDLGRVLGRDRLALELHRGRELVSARQPVFLEQRELLDLFDARELLVG